MGWGPSAIYTVEHESGWKVDDLRISNTVYERAKKGLLHYQARICIQVRHRIEKDYGGDPGFIYYEDLTFAKRRDVPASSKRPPKMKPASSNLKHVRTAGESSRR